MFYIMLFLNLILATVVSFVTVKFFHKPVKNILQRIIKDPISETWSKYMQFAGMVVGISSGIRIYEMEKYITPLYQSKDKIIVELTTERFSLEAFRTLIETLQGLAWMLFVFFLIALLAYVFVKISEMKYEKNKTDL